MDAHLLQRVLARLRPFVRDGRIRRSRIERVLQTVPMSADTISTDLERLLAESNILIEEDQPAPVAVGLPASKAAPMPRVASPPILPTPITDSAAIHAARRRIERDRMATNHAKVLLTAEEEVGLAMIIRGAENKPLTQGEFARLSGERRAAAVSLFVHNQGLIYSVAQRYGGTGMTFDDIAQHGAVGLIRAVELFDPLLGNKFSTYAMHWVRQAITRGIANDARLIRLPVHMVERLLKVWHTRTRLTTDGVPPTVHQLALACELTDEQILEALILGPQDMLSLDMPLGVDAETTLADFLAIADGADYIDNIEFEMLKDLLRVTFEALNEREANVIKLRYGLTGDAPMTLDEIGQVYGVTRERVRQIESKAMTKLRHPVRSDLLRPYLFGPEIEPERIRDRPSDDRNRQQD